MIRIIANSVELINALLTLENFLLNMSLSNIFYMQMTQSFKQLTKSDKKFESLKCFDVTSAQSERS